MFSLVIRRRHTLFHNPRRAKGEESLGEERSLEKEEGGSTSRMDQRKGGLYASKEALPFMDGVNHFRITSER